MYQVRLWIVCYLAEAVGAYRLGLSNLFGTLVS